MLTVLCGGFGAARLLGGLRSVVGPDELTCVVNVGDDLDYVGLHVSPDVDTVTYALAGEFDEERGWGRRGDTFRCNAALARFGDDWFSVGDADLTTSLKRTELLGAGRPLSDVTSVLAAPWRVLPVTDDRLRTVIETDDGPLGFQEWLVRHRGRPAVRGVRYEGSGAARPAPGVREALVGAEVVVLAPSNPVSSLGCLLAVSGVREALAERDRGSVMAVSPVVTGVAPRLPPEQGRYRVREALLAACGIAHDAPSVAALYRDLVGGFVLDAADAGERAAVADLGLDVLVADTLAVPGPGRAGLAEEVLAFGRRLGLNLDRLGPPSSGLPLI